MKMLDQVCRAVSMVGSFGGVSAKKNRVRAPNIYLPILISYRLSAKRYPRGYERDIYSPSL